MAKGSGDPQALLGEGACAELVSQVAGLVDCVAELAAMLSASELEIGHGLTLPPFDEGARAVPASKSRWVGARGAGG